MSRIYAANRIRELRKVKGLTQEDVAQGLGGTTTKGTIAKLETRAMALSLDYILGIANVLGVRPGEIITPLESDSREIPVIDAANAVNWREAVLASSNFVPVPALLQSCNLFAIRLEDDSVDQIMPRGGIVIVDPDDLDLIDSKVYLVESGSREVTIKRFSGSPPRLVPCSDDPVHRPIEIGREPFLTIGRLVFSQAFI